ncbi:MAG: Hsp70 family protein [Desulforegulaceae bacterium]|nr:Hsp70 family protein [Desulforegulaceae bacterium]
MNKTDFRYIIGIDLGTTNSAVSFIDTIEGKNAKIKQFPIYQITRKNEFSPLKVLPSFLYIPGTYELSASDINHPWPKKTDDFAGAFARDYGGKIPKRLVSSAKSWLCHDKVDRNSKFLPWGSDENVPKRSPVEVSAQYLIHLKNCWNLDKKQDDRLYFENQFIILTIPASFDEAARNLTLKAAELAGLKNVVLLEEPLAAFYSWLDEKEKKFDSHVKENELILVCDVGGGTSDFTLIALRKMDESLQFERIAVGDHLILGGDNIDLALARLAESKTQGKNNLLKGDKWKTLCHLSREAKENILEGNSEKERLTIVGEGSKLIKNTFSVYLEKKEVEDIVIKGFFPEVLPEETFEDKNKRKGITEFGLPYESEPEITKHLIKFLLRHSEDVKKATGKETPFPDLILFNGGSLKPEIIQKAIIKSIQSFFDPLSDLPQILENNKSESAVSLGASYYGKVKLGLGVKVGSGSPRSYYLGIETKDNKKGVLCLVERGLEEGSEIKLPKDYEFSVKTNMPVRFSLYSSSYRSGDKCGDFIENIDESFSELPPLHTIISYGKKDEKTDISIELKAKYTETGNLQIWCDSVKSQHTWDLSFDLRGTREVSSKIDTGVDTSVVIENSKVMEVLSLVESAFNGDKTKVNSVAKDVSRHLKMSRNKWPLMLIRKISDFLVDNSHLREKSPVHEARWLNFSGFCLRPGIGDPFDEARIKKIWSIYSKGLVFPNEIQNKNEWWVLWRRIAAGLKPGYQRQIIQDISSVLKKNKFDLKEKTELWAAVGNFEYLHSNDKQRFGNMLKNELKPEGLEPRLLIVFGRIGAREPLYGDINKVVPSDLALKWVDFLKTDKWGKIPEARYAISRMARLTGDRTRDIDEGKRNDIIKFLDSFEDFENSKYLKEIIEMESREEAATFGESLPSGIVLHQYKQG